MNYARNPSKDPQKDVYAEVCSKRLSGDPMMSCSGGINVPAPGPRSGGRWVSKGGDTWSGDLLSRTGTGGTNLIGRVYECLGAWLGEGVDSQGDEVEEDVVI